MPVLSVSRYSTLPSSSGMVLLRTTVPGIARSRWIIQEYTTLPISRLTRRLKESNNYCIGCRSACTCTCTCSSLLIIMFCAHSTECVTHAAFLRLSYIQRIARLHSAFYRLCRSLNARNICDSTCIHTHTNQCSIPDWNDV